MTLIKDVGWLIENRGIQVGFDMDPSSSKRVYYSISGGPWKSIPADDIRNSGDATRAVEDYFSHQNIKGFGHEK